MGLPIEQLTIATNSNDILARTVESGRYETRAVVATSSPSMDIQVSSNFERYLFEASGRDAGAIRTMMASLKQSGAFDLGAKVTAKLKSDFGARSAGEDEVHTVTMRVLDSAGYLLDPHTACGVVAADKIGAPSGVPQVILATAHPAKFPHTLTGQWPALPARLSTLMSDRERMTSLANDARTIEAYIGAHARQGRGRA